MRLNQIKPIAGMMTAIILVLAVGVVYLYATMDADTNKQWNELTDQEKLDELAFRESQREADRANNRRELYGDSSYCYRINNQSILQRCLDQTQESTAGSSQSANRAANTLEPLQNVSSNDERRFNRAELYQDPTYCDEITDTDLRVYCYDELS